MESVEVCRLYGGVGVGVYADWLSLSIDDFSGSLTDFGVNIQYQAFEDAGFGVDYQYFNLVYKYKGV